MDIERITLILVDTCAFRDTTLRIPGCIRISIL